MTDWDFEGANPIVNLAVALELASPVMPPAIQEIASKHSLFRRDLPRRLDQPMMLLPIPGQMFPPQTQIAGVVFDYVNSDGSVARALSVASNQISYMTTNYQRWKEFSPVLERMFTETINLLAAPVLISGIILTASNRFMWRGPNVGAELKGLLNDSSRMFAPNVMHLTEHCHSFHGYIEKRFAAPAGNYVRNVNIQTSDEPAGKVAAIVLSHRLALTERLAVDASFFGGNAGLGSQVMNELQDSNNKMFMDVVNQSISVRMPGLFV